MKFRLLFFCFLLSCSHPPVKVVPSKTILLADGYDTAVLKVYGTERQPKMQILGDARSATLLTPGLVDGHWEGKLQVGVMPGTVRVRVTSAQRQTVLCFTLRPQVTDSNSDGTPDFLRLEDESDREAFRRWFRYLAEIQYFITPDKRASEITDCSALVRYAYREALQQHDAAWAGSVALPVIPSLPSIHKYSFPHTPVGPDIFRTRGGTYSPADLHNGVFAEFANAATLQVFNVFFVSRDLTHAQPGDLLFYRRDTPHGVSYHSMIFLGPSQVKPDSEIYVVYHTGPDGTNNGEIRRLSVNQLLRFPNPQWQPIAANPTFLGVYRWNVLKAPS
jgi:uncharacterized protein YfaT (DUF1175 family)